MKRLKNTFDFVERASKDELIKELQKYGIEFEEEPEYFNEFNYVTNFEVNFYSFDLSKTRLTFGQDRQKFRQVRNYFKHKISNDSDKYRTYFTNIDIGSNNDNKFFTTKKIEAA